MEVSVIIPVYNAAPFIDQSIQSALDQPQTAEVLVIDDRSTDGSWEKCLAWTQKDSRVRLFKNEGPKGSGAARNTGLKNASCEYIAFLDADDYYLEGRFEVAEKLYELNEKIEGIGEVVMVVDNFHNIDSYVIGNYDSFDFINPVKYFSNGSLHIIGLSLKRKSVEGLYFDEGLKQTQDTDFILRCMEVCEVISGKKEHPVAVYNFHDNNTTHNLKERDKYRAIFYKRYAKKALLNYKNPKLFLKMLRYFRMYDYLYFFNQKFNNSRTLKIIFSFVQVFRFII